MLTRQRRPNQMPDTLSQQHQPVSSREVVQRHQRHQQTRREGERGGEKQPKRWANRGEDPVTGCDQGYGRYRGATQEKARRI